MSRLLVLPTSAAKVAGRKRSGSMVMKWPRPRASTTPEASRISPSRKMLRPLRSTSQPSTTISSSTGTGFRYLTESSPVTALILGEAADLGHDFVEKHGDDAAMNHSAAALIRRADAEAAANAPGGIVLLERQLHAALVRAAATEAMVRRIGFEQHSASTCSSGHTLCG